MALGSLVQRSAIDFHLIEAIERALTTSRESPPMEGDDWVRVSSMGAVCPREEVICSLYNIHRKERLEGKVIMNFGLGDAVHWLLQNRAFPAACHIVGMWRCTWCGETYGSRATQMVVRPDRCVRCGAIAGEAPRKAGRPNLDVRGDAFLYMEEWVGNGEFKIGGSPDGQMVLGDPENFTNDDITLLEIKSTNDNNYKKYKVAPDLMHIVQAQVYLWLTGYKKAKIVYMNKNGMGTDGMKEHDLDYDEEMIEQVKSIITGVRSGIIERIVPERTLCAHNNCDRAKRCQAAEMCFSNPQEAFKP